MGQRESSARGSQQPQKGVKPSPHTGARNASIMARKKRAEDRPRKYRCGSSSHGQGCVGARLMGGRGGRGEGGDDVGKKKVGCYDEKKCSSPEPQAMRSP